MMIRVRFNVILASVVILLIGLVSTTGCSKKDQSIAPSPTISSQDHTTGSSSGPSPATTGSAGTVIKLKTISYIDQQGIGTEAFKMLIPIDWQYEGGVQWVMDNPAMPAISQFRVWNPKGTEEFRVFPNQALFWTDNQGILSLFPISSKYFGNEVRPLLKPVQALKEIVIARFLTNVQGLKIINEQDISNLVNPGGAITPSVLKTSTEAGKVRVEYVENGKTIEDEIYCVVEATYFPMPGGTTNIMWGVNYISSFRAEKGKLDANAKIFQTVSRSVKLNLQWFNTYVQVIEYLIKMEIQQIKNIGQMGSIIAQTGSEIRQENLDLYNQREAMNDRVSQQFSEYVRGVDSYYNPLEQKNVELPTGYDNVWVNNLGEYILAENPSYNPNIGGNQNFQRLELAKK